MTIEKAKQLLGEKYKDYPNEEIQKIIDFLTSIGTIIVESYLKERED